MSLRKAWRRRSKWPSCTKKAVMRFRAFSAGGPSHPRSFPPERASLQVGARVRTNLVSGQIPTLPVLSRNPRSSPSLGADGCLHGHGWGAPALGGEASLWFLFVAFGVAPPSFFFVEI